MKRIGLYYVATGRLGEHEDWWTLIEHDDGSHHVEHDWDRKDAPAGDRAKGPDTLTVDQTLMIAPLAVTARLRSVLDE